MNEGVSEKLAGAKVVLYWLGKIKILKHTQVLCQF